MKRKLMMLIATVVMVAGLTACGSEDTNAGKPIDTDKGIENGVAVDPTESTVDETEPVESEPVVENTIPVIEDKPAFTTFEIRDIEMYNGINGDYVFVADGEPIDINETIANTMFRIPEDYELTWEDIESVKDRIAKGGWENGGICKGILLTYAEYPGSEFWDKYVKSYYNYIKKMDPEAESNALYDITLTEEEFKNLYIEFITNYSIADMNELFHVKYGELSKGENMSEEAKKFLPISRIIEFNNFSLNYDQHNNNEKDMESFRTNPEKFEFVSSNK